MTEAAGGDTREMWPGAEGESTDSVWKPKDTSRLTPVPLRLNRTEHKGTVPFQWYGQSAWTCPCVPGARDLVGVTGRESTRQGRGLRRWRTPAHLCLPWARPVLSEELSRELAHLFLTAVLPGDPLTGPPHRQGRGGAWPKRLSW